MVKIMAATTTPIMVVTTKIMAIITIKTSTMVTIKIKTSTTVAATHTAVLERTAMVKTITTTIRFNKASLTTK